MPNKNPRSAKPKAVEAPPATTNFRQIKGINQLLEARLHRAGITTFEALANLLPEEILTALGNLKGVTSKQIVEQDWIGQALKLAGKKAPVNGSLGSEGFIVDIFLSKKKLVHSTQILHVSSDEGDKWDGWDSDRLLDFIVSRSGLVRLKVETVQAEIPVPSTTRTTVSIEPLTPLAQSVEPIEQPLPIAPPVPPPPVPELVYRTFEMIPSHSQTPSKLLRKGEPFDIRVSLESENVMRPIGTRLDYTVSLSAKDLDASQQFNLGEVSGVLSSADEAIVMNIPRQDLAPGTYRLEASLTFCKEAKNIANPAQMRTIFQVF